MPARDRLGAVWGDMREDLSVSLVECGEFSSGRWYILVRFWGLSCDRSRVWFSAVSDRIRAGRWLGVRTPTSSREKRGRRHGAARVEAESR